MAQIRFAKPRPPLNVADGVNLMQALLAGGLPVASSCKGDGVCAKCRIEIVDGHRNLSPQNEREVFLRERHEVPKNQRISCQTTVHGDITVTTSYW
ncbi:MAG: 2Fe-2S iron-sulfur cluster-binding protein [Bdellovibrionota bacterium]